MLIGQARDRELLAVADRLDAEPDEIGGPDELDREVDLFGPLNDRAEADGHQHEDREQAERVAHHGRQRDAAAIRQRPADHEDDTGPGDRDEDERRQREAQQVIGGNHGAILGRPIRT